MHASIADGTVEHVSQSGDSRVIGKIFDSVFGPSGDASTNTSIAIQHSLSTVSEYRGLTYSDALSLLVNKEESNLHDKDPSKPSVVRPYLGSIRLRVSAGMRTSWQTYDYCWGTKTVSTLSKMNDTNLYIVHRTVTVFTVEHSEAGQMEYL